MTVPYNGCLLVAARVLSGEIGLGGKHDVHAHIFRPHPLLLSLCLAQEWTRHVPRLLEQGEEGESLVSTASGSGCVTTHEDKI